VRDRFPLVVLVALVFAAGSGALLLQTAQRGAFADPLSTYRSAPDGARALYLLAAESGLPVSRRHLDLKDLPTAQDRPRLLVLLGIESVGDDELGQLQRFVTEGGALLVVARAPPKDEKKDEKEKSGLRGLSGFGRRAVLEAFQTSLLPTEGEVAERDLEVGVPSPLVAGVEMAQARVASYLTRAQAEGELPLLVDPHGDGGRVAIAFAHGAGRVVAVSSADLASNRALARADNARFWLSVLATLSEGRTIEFDEHHHGFTGERSISGYAARYGLHWALLQLVAALFVWVLALKRFGRPRAVQAEERVAKADYLLAMARIYRQGGHRSHAAQALVSGLVRALGRYAGASARAGEEEVALALERRGRLDLARALRALASRRAAAAQSDRALLSLARGCAGVRARMGARGPAASPRSGKPSSRRAHRALSARVDSARVDSQGAQE
jgi:hypothetical protein